jgi:hypothetical protein
MGIQWMLCWWMLVHHGPKNAKDQLVLLPAMDGHTQKVSKDMFGACKYLLAYNHHAHNIGSLQVELKNKADCPFFSLNEHFSFVVCVLRMNMGRNLHMIWCICIASHPAIVNCMVACSFFFQQIGLLCCMEEFVIKVFNFITDQNLQ